MRKVHLVTFGCQMNKLDSELAAETLADAGHLVVDDESLADTVVFNTCSVRDHAEQRVLSRLAQLKPRRLADPDFRLGIMGCFAERDGEDLLRKLPHLDFALGTRQFLRLPEVLERLDLGDSVKPEKAGLFGPAGAESPGIHQSHPRARHQGIQGFVSVMRGCDNRCSYCIVPDVRGGEVSRPAGEIAAEVRALALAGAREVTLLGQNIDAYGKHDNTSLSALLRLIDETAGPETGLVRLRFVTSHPCDISRELVETVRDLGRVAAHFHMPAQSGSTRILAAMRRGYTREEYDDKLAMIRDVLPDASIASDFIVGFPGESEADYLATRELVETARFTNSYIFKYSPRPGTPSALTMEDDVPDIEKKRRNNDLLAVQNSVNANRGAGLVGRRFTVLAEGVSSRDARRWTGRTEENMICVFDAPPEGEAFQGRLVEVEVESATPLTLFCRRVDGNAREQSKD
ncbi:MAG: tRNA (N6-isopentenyl adenosine(37)-C2)-methylthiotransferase MiaB [Planctomycetaceae bacterium]|nr:tRNA (N6-isopentenyl adenosine(37)-C2)-methylthiotransferase MiaB [Planctomycetaceae bacterium]